MTSPGGPRGRWGHGLGNGAGPDLQEHTAPSSWLRAQKDGIGFSQPPLCWAAKGKISRGQGQDCGETWPPRIQQEMLWGWWSGVNTQQGELAPALPPCSIAAIFSPLFSRWVPGLAVGAAAGRLAPSQPLPDGAGLSDVLRSIPVPAPAI